MRIHQTYYLHMGADPMKWEEADLMGDVPPPRWRHTATLLPDGVRSAPPSPRCPCRPDATRPLLTLCLPAAALTSQDNIMMFGGHCKGRHAAGLTAPIPAFSPSSPPSPPPPPPRPCAPRCTCSPRTSLRSACRRYNDVHVLSVEKNEWSIKECAGSLPQPRSHARKSRRRPASASSGAAWLPRRHPSLPPTAPAPQLGAARPWP